MPQLPQLSGSLVVFVQVPEHIVWPVAQLVPHSPPEQTPVQTLPQAPQLLLSDCTLTQVLPPSSVHRAWPPGQTHTPLLQRSLPVHALPHVPQLSLSELVFVQVIPASPPHRVLPPGQEAWQPPLMHA